MPDSVTMIRLKAELRAELWRDYRVSIPRPLIARMEYVELKAIRNLFRQHRAAPDAYAARQRAKELHEAQTTPANFDAREDAQLLQTERAVDRNRVRATDPTTA